MASNDPTMSEPATGDPEDSRPWDIWKNTAADAIKLQNANNSMILRLPAEIRRKIWEFLLGNRLIHFRAVIHGEGRHRKRLENGNLRVFDWISTFCSCPYTEMELYERSKMHVDELTDRDDRQLSEKIDPTGNVAFIGTAEQRLLARKSYLKQNPHVCCYNMATDFFAGQALLPHEDRNCEKRRRFMLDLRVLRVCHQFYDEISPVLWTTNTFSFTSGRDLEMFLSDCTHEHECMIRSLRMERLWINWDHKRMFQKEGLLKSLKGLQDLHIHIVNNAYSYLTAEAREDLMWQASIDRLCCITICDYSIDPPLKNIKNATVVFQDHPYGLWRGWPLRVRLEQAERLRRFILDSECEAVFREQHRLREESNRLGSRF